MKKLLFPILFIGLLWTSCTDKSISQPMSNGGGAGRNSGNHPNPSPAPSLAGTNWRLTQYQTGTMTNPQPRTDTLIFIDATNLTWSHVPCTYSLVNNDLGLHLTFFGSVFGDISGMPTSAFLSYGQILGLPFTQINTSNGQTYYLWLQKF